MLKRSVTVSILIALLVFVTAAAGLLWSLQQQTFATIDAERRVESQVGVITATLSSIATAQQGYVAPGQLDEPLFEETAVLLARLAEQVEAIGPMLRSPQAVAHLDPLRQAVIALQAADARTRENLIRGQELMAADVIYSDGRNVVDAITSKLREAQGAERVAATASHAQASRWLWVLFGVMTLASGGAIAFLVTQTRRAVPPMAQATAPPVAVAVAVTAAPSIDQGALAALCTDVSRASDVQTLERALERTAGLLEASSVMLWMSAGNQLFPALAHGFPADVLPRLKPIARDAENAAAAAWRDGRVVRLAAGAGDAGAAIVAPLFSPDAAIGVFAVELKAGRVPDNGREAAVVMIAAQLSTVVSAWPAASVPQPARAPEARTA